MYNAIMANGGIIPARAGFTPHHRQLTRPYTDHPRSRGVYPVEITDTLSGRGSSPLARGLPGKHLEPPSGRRIIPARAGFTVVADVRGETQWDHPRSRGVYHVRPASLLPIPGSSPLARGLRGLDAVGGDLCGIIPARAGFTGNGVCRGFPASDHPRSRGVYPGMASGPAIGLGSSPLARGLRGRWPGRGRRDRIIPARAGFTHS